MSPSEHTREPLGLAYAIDSSTPPPMMNATWERMTYCATPYGMRSTKPIEQVA